ncbi:CvpA family protein [Neisseria shayeganii]|uniref:Colicin V production protein n=1 Tax=Neisseria shayeganii 871 TaxID=1032488 RepID=G4CJ13_9NEIS|nr:CvpA family protein [Neisseria shayeganii]EGY52107.1 colicin V production protein [Neisseria shayeganii 871]
MTLFDYLALGTVAAFTLISLFRGVLHELVGLLSWVAAFIAARFLAVPVADTGLRSIEPPALAVVAAFILVFLAVRLGMMLLQSVLSAGVRAVGLDGANRLLGAAFGALKGVLAVTVAVLACAFTELPQSPEWRDSQTAFVFEGLASLAVPYLPPFVAEQIHYQPLSTE